MGLPTMVKVLREHQGLTQVKLAVKSDVDPKTLYRSEDTDTIDSISLGNIKKIAAGLGVNPAMLIDPDLASVKLT